VALDAPPDSDLVHAVVSTAQARAVEGPVGRVDAHDLGERDYRDHLEGMLAHLARAAVQEVDARATEQAERERYAAERESLVGEIDAHVQKVREDVEAMRAPVGQVVAALADRLDAALRLAPGAGSRVLPFHLVESPRLVVDDVLRPVADAARAVSDAVAGVRTARASAERADRLQEWRRTRRRGIGRDVALLGLGFGLGIAWLVYIYWFSGPIGPFSLVLAALFVSGLMAGWVTLCRSWTFGRLADKPEDRGGLEAFLLMGGIALCLYGPAPRPEREDLEKFLFGWLDALTVVVAPLIGVVLIGCALRNVRALVRLPAAPAAGPSVDAVGARG
jgi:hypothetical protein